MSLTSNTMIRIIHSLPVIAALAIIYAGKTAAYPPGPRESVWKSPRPVADRDKTDHQTHV